MMKNYISLIYCLILFTASLSAQGWEQTYPVNSSAKHILPHPIEGYMVLGNDKLSHINNEGESLWSISQGGQYMIETSDGAFLIAGNPGGTIQLFKVFPNGTLGNSSSLSIPFDHYLRGIVEMDNGDLVMTGLENETSPTDGNVFIIRTDSEGSFISKEILSGYFCIGGLGGNIAKDESDNIVISARRADNVGGVDVRTIVIMKFSPSGQLLWETDIYQTNPFSLEIIQRLISTNDDGFCVSYLDNSQPENVAFNVAKFSFDGDLEWSNEFSETYYQSIFISGHNYYTVARGLTETLNGDILVTTRIADASTNNATTQSNIELNRLSSNGSSVWTREIGIPGVSDYAYVVIEDNNENILLGGLRGSKCYVSKLNSDGYIYTNVISGNLVEDIDGNCQVDPNEPSYQGWIVRAAGNQSFYALTDEEGYYELRVDSGSYIVNAIQPNPYRSSCVLDVNVDFPLFNGSETIDFPITEDIDCPYLIVDIGTPFLRRCFSNIYHVNYCNSGTTDSEDTYIEIDFDSYLTVNSSSASYVVVDGTYFFDIGNLAANECGDFTVSVTVDCDSTVLGQTHCVEARIYPDSICVPNDPNWSGASLDLTASCIDGNVTFTTTNVGSGNMVGDLNYFVIEDQIVMLSGSDDPLEIGEFSSLTIPASGSTFRLEVDQIPGHPNMQMPSVAIEGCSSDSSFFSSLGFITMYPEYDGSPSVSIDCQENIGSFDPNDKAASPKGYDDDHFIEANTDIEYKIRFQNTGTDTAFLVTIIDTLSTLLDPATIRPGASSHPYTYNLENNGALTFTFSNIMLPDSNVNEPASHGFVKFKISQQRDNPIGSIIHNDADIYFDNNSPILTNDAWHTIGADYTIVSSTEVFVPNVDIINYPNPFGESTTFEISGEQYEKAILRIYDVMGRSVRSHSFTNNRLQFERNGLASGLYFYEIIIGSENLIGSGKLMVE